MAAFTDDELALLALSAAGPVGPGGIARLRAAAARRRVSLRDVLGLPKGKLQSEVGLRPDAAACVAAMRSPALTGRSLVDRLCSMDIYPLIEGRPGWPERLTLSPGESAPAVLFVKGDPSILSRSCVAVVGSRRPSREALGAAGLFAYEQAAAGATVVSGGARGIDSAGRRAALKAGATAVIAPVGMVRFRWEWFRPDCPPRGRWCVLSQFPPDNGWENSQALRRNRLIVALSRAVVAFDPRDSGGTWNSCAHALGLGKPLFVVRGARGEANKRAQRKLVRRGAVALDPARMPDAAAFARLVEEYIPPPTTNQAPLFG
ncbi:MAG: DNA-processing protein DprA [Planctomycetes bacterium]|nr:DNA-processing protein DprA [Planctomycetota bacterium]